MKPLKILYFAAGIVILAVLGVFAYRLFASPLGYTVATDYQKALSAPMTSAQTFVPVTSLTLKDGTTLSMATLGDYVFLTLEPGTANEEIVVCTAIDATAKRFTGCTRGLAFSGTSLAGVSANQKTHSSGATVVMSNVHYVYQQFFDKNGTAQTVSSSVSFMSQTPTLFYSFPYTTSSAYPVQGNQFATKAYADSLTIAGAAPSTTRGMAMGSDNTLYVNASSTASDNGGYLLFSTSTIPGQIFWDIKSFLARATTWIGAQIFSGTVTFNGSVTALSHLFVPTPTAPTDATNKTYVDSLTGSSIYGDGSDGAGVISSDTTLSRDMYYASLTVNSGKTLTTANYRIFVTGTLTNNGTISAAGTGGGNGGNGSASVCGTAGATSTAVVSGSVPQGTTGVGGGICRNAGNAGISVAYSVATTTASAGGAGGKGCDVSVASNGGGAAGAGTNTVGAIRRPSNVTDAGNLFDITASASSTYSATFHWFSTAPGASGGGGGGGLRGGAGGAAGESGHFGFIAARTLVNNGTITAAGGAGGNGGNGGVFNFEQWGGGGGGGGGGSGGALILIYSTSTSGTVTVAGGAAGSGGTSGAVGGGTCPTTLLDGTAGTTGTNGTVYRITTNP